MEPINLLVNISVDDEFSRQIAAISPRLKIRDISGLTSAEQKGDLSREAELDALLAGAEIHYGFGLPRNVARRAPGLKWAQVISAGVDRFLTADVRESRITLTNSSGVMAVPISEFVLQLMLMFVKQAPACFRMKQEREWRRFGTTVLRSRTVGIVGLGHIGREIARLSRAFGMRVIATRRSAKKETSARNVDRLLPAGQLEQLLRESDFVVISVPLTGETRNMIGEKELRAMKPSACLINIARGAIVDEAALVSALSENRIAGAGLDVFATEPLPADSGLWELPNVILSPHVSFGMEDLTGQTHLIFYENLKRYLAGKRLINVVNKKRGY